MEQPAGVLTRHVAPGGWRRVVVGAAVGVAAGLLARAGLRRTPRDGARG